MFVSRIHATFLTLAFCSLLPLSAQTQAINGSIRGRIADAAAAPVPQAKVTIVNDQTGFARTASTDEDGYYAFPNLPLGTYTLTI
jgi:hypothetical protein